MSIMTALSKLDKNPGKKNIKNNGSVVDMLNELTVEYGGKPTTSGNISAAVLAFVDAVSDELSIPRKVDVTPGVKFVDYDGTEVARWTVAKALVAEALPANPSHKRLVAQGWNWTLSDIQDYLTDYPDAVVTVGQMYTTKSGASEFDIELKEEDLSFALFMAFRVNGTATIDWGDGSEIVEVESDDALLETTILKKHQYNKTGAYTVKFAVGEGGEAALNGLAMAPVGMTEWDDSNISLNFVHTYDARRVFIGNGLVSVGQYAFADCYALTELTIPSSVTSIGNQAFYNCNALTELTIPSSVTSIGQNALYNCYALTELTIPGSVTSIGNQAFYNCNALTELAIPSSVTSIGNQAFHNCNALTELTIPSSVTSISQNAFTNCTALTELTIPSSVTSISQYTFSNCKALTELAIPSSVTSIGSRAFQNCNALTELAIPSSVTSIGQNAFTNCNTLTELTIPSSVTSIEQNAFTNCYALTELTIPSSVTSIGNQAFQNCYALTELTIPTSVTSIGQYALYNCCAIESLTIEATTPPTLGTSALFNLPPTATIYVPAASVDTYKAATNWSAYADRIEAIPA